MKMNRIQMIFKFVVNRIMRIYNQLQKLMLINFKYNFRVKQIFRMKILNDIFMIFGNLLNIVIRISILELSGLMDLKYGNYKKMLDQIQLKNIFRNILKKDVFENVNYSMIQLYFIIYIFYGIL